jgi:short-subunit dehydrogenase
MLTKSFLLHALILTILHTPITSFYSSSKVAVRHSFAMSLDSTCNKLAAKAFSGCTVLITGASGGLGRALSLQLAYCKAQTLILSGRNEDSLKEVESQCKEIYSDIIIHTITCDLSDKLAVTNFAQKVLDISNNRIDVLFNNGGISSRSRFIDTTTDVDERVMQINFFSGSIIAKALVPGMIERGFGRIIWISSVQGLCKYVFHRNEKIISHVFTLTNDDF